ncbi:lipid IV(A) 4-amino-4-deoxy-L-arabinosyltransferase [Pantoea stewartii]|uniref:Undecaprenyl phosphate-alpha-4-amino-4-deoxy-L-arabinose arabinosyl transferase n=1 Tax=Pantoea stewartii subsp. stewartii DC283 TaxID=660596 RepID=H3RK86_PANSE|nr:lipid IV(A) 4-amino-4-deoxy-L-arabinosyltransferase [Pantoea stewartii]ARF52567.1 4-amino-4-deoxy-L-arabinose lipid A transferase [Pantoea stewartii subsp. stewartii DC283]EHT98127.1 polymyxin/melittin resistance undecaprenyl phosphate-alpha-L-Ara4N transferase [Pantoea stewartii subsp. stewartii DC283]KAB0549414.1 lipid IV(A) 4-amino-4-deoxy-L-arabinosyltransferase [Pantoea stewartii subsp. stewartii]
MTATKKTVLLVSLFVLYYLLPLEFRNLWQPDETRYAEISREMLQNGNWITPHFFGLRYFEKPIAGYWFNTVGQAIFGHNNFAVRIGSVFSTLMSAILIYWLGCRLFARRTVALTASVIFMTSLLVYGIGTYAVLDPMLTLWMVAAMCSYWFASEAQNVRQRILRYLILGLACGMGFMTKGFLALAVPVLAILPWAILNQRFRELVIYGPLAIVSAAAISAPWAIAIQQQQPDFWHYFFWVEHIQRFAEDNAQHKAPFWYYLPVLIAGALPWLALLPGALRSGWTERQQSSGGVYLLSWVVIPLVFFSIAKGKLPTYILPCFAPLALLMADYAWRKVGENTRVFKVNAWINILFGAICVVALLVVLAPWGLSHRPLYGAHQLVALIMAVIAFAGWAVAGAFSLKSPQRNWLAAALCPLALALCVGSAIPESVENTKQPQVFIRSIENSLANSRYILSDNSGVSSAIAWTLKRSDIIAYSQKGELQYGLSYPDAQSAYVSSEDFPQWLQAHRKQGNVSLIMMLERGEATPTDLPPADAVYRNGRMLLLQYNAAN